MDFQKSTDINMDIHDFWMSVFNYPYKCGYPHNIQARIFMQGHSAMDIHEQKISMNGNQCFMDISIQLCMILWISIWISLDFYGYPCIDLLWVLDPGMRSAIGTLIS